MPLRDLIKPLPGSTAPDRALYNDHYDLKIDNLTTEVIAVCDAVDGMFTTGAPPTGVAGGGLAGTYPNPTLASGIDATKIADGTVTSTEFQYINTLASNAQTQINSKLTTADIFLSTEQTGTGSSQSVAHGLGVIPSKILLALTNVDVGGATITEGTHTITNIVVTVTSAAKFKVLAIV